MEQENPTPSTSVATNPPLTSQSLSKTHLANEIRRSIAGAADFIFIFLPFLILGKTFVINFDITGAGSELVLKNVSIAFIAYAWASLYFFLTARFFQTSLGGKLMRTIIVPLPTKSSRLLLRSLIVPISIWLYPFFLLSSCGQTLADFIGRTQVVDKGTYSTGGVVEGKNVSLPAVMLRVMGIQESFIMTMTRCLAIIYLIGYVVLFYSLTQMILFIRNVEPIARSEMVRFVNELDRHPATLHESFPGIAANTSKDQFDAVINEPKFRRALQRVSREQIVFDTWKRVGEKGGSFGISMEEPYILLHMEKSDQGRWALVGIEEYSSD